MIRRLDQNEITTTDFKIGQVVTHKHYGYRGVIVAFDHQCKAPDSWYLKNQSQPERHQPWYHILVDRSMTATYAAQENLKLDDNTLPVEHPLIELYFSNFDNGLYQRNDEPWQGWHE